MVWSSECISFKIFPHTSFPFTLQFWSWKAGIALWSYWYTYLPIRFWIPWCRKFGSVAETNVKQEWLNPESSTRPISVILNVLQLVLGWVNKSRWSWWFVRSSFQIKCPLKAATICPCCCPFKTREAPHSDKAESRVSVCGRGSALECASN